MLHHSNLQSFNSRLPNSIKYFVNKSRNRTTYMLFYVGVDSGQLWCCWSSGTGNLLILQCSDFLNFSGGNSGFLPSCPSPRSRFCLKCSLKQVKQRFFSEFKDVHRKTSVPNFVQNVKNQRFVRLYTKESLLKREYGMLKWIELLQQQKTIFYEF